MAFSMNDNFIIANYHYVENPRPDFSGIHPCSVQELERQISFFAKHFSFVSIPELFAAAQRGENKKLCAITFDDGLKDQYDHAATVLKKYNASATFFIITATLQGRVPLAHKIHTMTSYIPMNDVLEKFNIFLSDVFPNLTKYLIPKDRRLTDKRRYDDIISANVKETLMIVPHDVSDAFLTHMVRELGIDERELAKKLFMNVQEIQTLDKEGFFIESHTHNHYALSGADPDVQRNDFDAAEKVFQNMLGRFPKVMAYPYGRPPETDEVLYEYGFTHAVTVESRTVSGADNPLHIPRFDTNDIKIFLDT